MGDRVTSSSGKSRYNPCYTRCSPLWECGGALHKDSRTYRRHRDRFGQKTGASGDGAIGKGRKSRKAQRRASGRGRGGKNFGVGEAISPVSLEARKAGGAPANSGPVSREFVQCSREDGEGEGEEGASDYATIGSGSAKWEGRREELELRGGEGVEIDQWETEGELDTIVERSALDNEVCQPRGKFRAHPPGKISKLGRKHRGDRDISLFFRVRKRSFPQNSYRSLIDSIEEFKAIFV